MSDIPRIIERISGGDPALNQIHVARKQYTDAEMNELTNFLLGCPDAAREVWLNNNQLTDETGVDLTRYVAFSTTIQLMNLRNNRFGETTYLKLAAALQINTSLAFLCLSGNLPVDRTRIDAAFVNLLRLTPDRPVYTEWYLYSFENDFARLKHAANELGHPTLQMILNHVLEKREIETIKRIS